MYRPSFLKLKIQISEYFCKIFNSEKYKIFNLNKKFNKRNYASFSAGFNLTLNPNPNPNQTLNQTLNKPLNQTLNQSLYQILNNIIIIISRIIFPLKNILYINFNPEPQT